MLWFLSGLYARLGECSEIRWVDRYEVVIYVDVNFLQLFLWERFRALSPIPKEFKPVKHQVVDGIEKVKTSLLKCRG